MSLGRKQANSVSVNTSYVYWYQLLRKLFFIYNKKRLLFAIMNSTFEQQNKAVRPCFIFKLSFYFFECFFAGSSPFCCVVCFCSLLCFWGGCSNSFLFIFSSGDSFRYSHRETCNWLNGTTVEVLYYVLDLTA